MSAINFIPVRITEDKLDKINIENGYLYFTTDT